MAKGKLSFQKVAEPVPTEPEEGQTLEPTSEEGPVLVEAKPWGGIYSGTFGIKITAQEKNEASGKIETVVKYKQDKEPFKFPQVKSLVHALIYAGATFDEAQVDKFGEAIGEGNTEAVDRILTVYNTKLRADAKTSAYQSLVQKHKPLEGEDREIAVAKTIRGFIKLAGISAETAIEVLKAKGAVKPDYTVEDYNGTKLRKSSADDED